MSASRDPFDGRVAEALLASMRPITCDGCLVLNLVHSDAGRVCRERVGEACRRPLPEFARADGKTAEDLAHDEELERQADEERRRRLSPWVRLEDLVADLEARTHPSPLRRLYLNEWTTPADPSRPSFAERARGPL